MERKIHWSQVPGYARNNSLGGGLMRIAIRSSYIFLWLFSLISNPNDRLKTVVLSWFFTPSVTCWMVSCLWQKLDPREELKSVKVDWFPAFIVDATMAGYWRLDSPIRTAVEAVACRIFLAGKATFTIGLLFSNTSNSNDESSSEVSLLDSSAHS